MSESNGVKIQSLERAFEILRLFKKHDEIGISEIAQSVNLSKSTAFGLVNTLVKIGFLEKDADSKKYRLGMELFELGTLVENRMDIKKTAQPYCVMLSQKYCLTVHLAANKNGEVLYIDKYDQPDFFIMYSQVGQTAPMTCTGLGKAMLAFEDENYLQKYIFSKPFPVKNENSIADEETLRKILADIKNKGYACDNGEISNVIKCYAAPIFNRHKKPIAAISVSGIVNKMENENAQEIIEDVKNAAKEISLKMGYREI